MRFYFPCSDRAMKSCINLLKQGYNNRSPLNRFASQLQGEKIVHLKQVLSSVLGSDNVSTAESVCQQHGRDEGPFPIYPADIVVWPRSAGEVSEVAKICAAHQVPMTPFGSGTGLEAGVGVTQGGVSVDVSKIDQVVSFHPEDFDITVQPGITRKALNHFLKDHGLWFPVDPGADCSLCGMAATSASGTNAVRYGTMRENVLNLQVVLANGAIFHTAGDGRRSRKTSAGYNLTNLFVGSEGTLGFITEVTLRLHALPETMVSAVCAFPDVKAAVDTVLQTLQSSIPIARIELLDELAIDVCNKYSKVDYAVQPTLFLEFHGSEYEVTAQAEAVAEIARDNGGSDFLWAREAEERNKLWKARHELLYATLALKPGHRAVVTDVCVPISKLPDLVFQTQKDIHEASVTSPILGHVGDGNFHAFMLFDPENPADFKKAKAAAERLAERALALNGTCTGEHGIGLGKKDLLAKEIGPVGLSVMKSIKAALDPHNLMNPGKVLNID